MKICDGSSRYVVVRRWRVWCIANIYARSMFCSPGSICNPKISKGVVYAISYFFSFKCP